MGGFDVWFTALVEEVETDGGGGGGGGIRSVMSGDSEVLAALRRCCCAAASSSSRGAGAGAARNPCLRLVGKSFLLSSLWLASLRASGVGGSSRRETDLDRGSWIVVVDDDVVCADGAGGASADVGDVTSGSDGSARWPTERGSEEKKGEPVDAVRNTVDRAVVLRGVVVDDNDDDDDAVVAVDAAVVAAVATAAAAALFSSSSPGSAGIDVARIRLRSSVSRA